jgi:hypothetical protein
MFSMLQKSMHEQLDGYVLALSRCMEHDLAWHCISQAFEQHKQPIADKYYTRFNRTREKQPNQAEQVVQ